MSGELRPYAPEYARDLEIAQAYSFGVDVATVPKWLERAGHENVRCFVAGRRLAGGLLVVPMGIFFGGRSVKNLGIAGVAIGALDRGRGYAYEMMAQAMREARQNGWAVSTLYPATISLYRKVGYELAGGHYSISLKLGNIPAREKGGELISITAADQEKLISLQRPQAVANDGNLDRGQYIWDRVFAPRFEQTTGVGFSFDGKLEGYVVLRQKPSSESALS
jgi:predicted acetyltransferase